MSDAESRTPFAPVPRDFTGHPMPRTVPAGARLELSRARIAPSRGTEFDEWMQMLTTRYEEATLPLSAERSAFEATFRHTDAAGTDWIYHLTLAGDNGSGLNESNPIDADHAAFSRRVKEPGWEELEPRFMLTPQPLREAMQEWTQTGEIAAPGADAPMRPILAALANPAAREIFARVTLGDLPADRTVRQERALAQLENAGLITRSVDQWSVDEGNLRRLLQQGSRRRPNTGPERFLTADGRIDRYPSQHGERDGFLRFVAGRVLAADETLSEAELGARLSVLTADIALLRRMLVDHGILTRDPAGAEYRLAPPR